MPQATIDTPQSRIEHAFNCHLSSPSLFTIPSSDTKNSGVQPPSPSFKYDNATYSLDTLGAHLISPQMEFVYAICGQYNPTNTTRPARTFAEIAKKLRLLKSEYLQAYRKYHSSGQGNAEFEYVVFNDYCFGNGKLL